MDWSIYSNYRLIYKLDGVHRLFHSWDRPPIDVHGNSAWDSAIEASNKHARASNKRPRKRRHNAAHGAAVRGAYALRLCAAWYRCVATPCMTYDIHVKEGHVYD